MPNEGFNICFWIEGFSFFLSCISTTPLITKGGAYNPLTVSVGAFSGDFGHFFFDIGSRIPALVSSFFFGPWNQCFC
jgi:hypothetical protein